MAEPRLILASNSPRRREMIAWLGWSYALHVPGVDETPLEGEVPADYVLRLAQDKCRAAARSCAPGALVLAADTTVADGSELLGKPETPEEARRMLRQLRGRAHQVLSAVALSADGGQTLESEVCRSAVQMRAYSDTEMERYITSGDPLDKAGAYAIQSRSFNPVEGFAGCFASVTGLPLCHLLRTLRRLGCTPPADVPRACQSFYHYACPISAAVLRGEPVG
jgi:MAF protein